MQRYFLNYPKLKIGDEITFSKEQSHHIQRVLRMQTGDQVIGVDQNQSAFLLQLIIEDIVKATVVETIEKNNELSVQVDFACGLPKGKKLEHVVQKASELGVSRIYPWQADRSVVRWNGKKSKNKIQRLQKIATEASEQSHRNFEVQVENLVHTKDILEIADQYDYVLVAYEESAKQGEQSQLAHIFQHLGEDARILMIFGPEGGMSDDEIEQFQTIEQMKLVGLGQRVLRTETAPLFALSALVYELELR